MGNSVTVADSLSPSLGMGRCVLEKGAASGGIIASLIQSARRQETLIEALTLAVDSGDEAAILGAARNLAANRRRDTSDAGKKRAQKSRRKPSNGK